MAADLSRREALATALALTALPAARGDEKPKPAEKPAVIPENALVVLVMDPLSKDLSCPCVSGYGQRDYDKFGKYLAGKVGRPVAVVYGESLPGALKKSEGKAHLIIGKDSVIRATAPGAKLEVTQLAALTGKDGKTTQTGLVCVAAADKAITPADLKGYTIYFGNAAAEEKSAAAVQALKEFGLEVPARLDTCATCSEGATKVVEEAQAGKKVAAVISSYAQPLLEGCGTIKKGALRVIAETDPVPFIAAFATGSLTAAERDAVRAALLAVGKDKDLSAAIETKAGFIEPAKKK
ncbi:phosphate/phosphite/phosphonate ABC transporter substrate-binding protein [Gemmata sp. JC717]|uniref:phosphate/phosphite/phosphonate ABC transporter substrate-binding protein n=1 Tax=Gemmata algarum TaxID=2975278 RepID=UPI0021BAECDF|nr:phosphate/phosphite/phosphonate ABC transporter substrate-binding protein [Gemmata algarum]MDY3556404.1 phosphate/phosphite/phosphonate ABC transporter substrate-binding protein [Gemmata algarum]